MLCVRLCLLPGPIIYDIPGTWWTPLLYARCSFWLASTVFDGEIDFACRRKSFLFDFFTWRVTWLTWRMLLAMVSGRDLEKKEGKTGEGTACSPFPFLPSLSPLLRLSATPPALLIPTLCSEFLFLSWPHIVLGLLLISQ